MYPSVAWQSAAAIICGCGCVLQSADSLTHSLTQSHRVACLLCTTARSFWSHLSIFHWVIDNDIRRLSTVFRHDLLALASSIIIHASRRCKTARLTYRQPEIFPSNFKRAYDLPLLKKTIDGTLETDQIDTILSSLYCPRTTCFGTSASWSVRLQMKTTRL